MAGSTEHPGRLWTWRDVALVAFVATVAGALPAPMLDLPFSGSHDGWGGAFYSTAARNLGLYPLSTSWGAMLTQVGPTVAEPRAYANHPPLIVWLVAASQALFGASEATARVVPWTFSVLTAATATVLLRALAVPRTLAAAGVLLAVGTPLWGRYAAMVDPQGSGPLFSMVLLPLLALVAARRPGPAATAGLLLALPFGLLFDWPAWGSALLVAGWLLARGPTRRAGATLMAAILFWAVLVIGWTLCLDGPVYDAPPALGFHPTEGFINRAGLKPRLLDDAGGVLSWSEVWHRIAQHHRQGLTWPLSVLAVPAVVLLLRRALRGRAGLALLVIPGVVGLAYVLLFPQGAYTHDYWQIYLALGAALPVVGWLAESGLPTRVPWLGPALLGMALLLCIRSGLIVRAHATAPDLDALRHVSEAVVLRLGPARAVTSSAPRSVVIEHYTDRPIAWHADPTALGADVAVLEPPGGALIPAVRAARGPGEPLPGGWTLWPH